MAGLFSSLNPFSKSTFQPKRIADYVVSYEAMRDTNIPEELIPHTERFHQQAKTNPNQHLATELRQCIAKYPNVPSLKNYLYTTLVQIGQVKEAKQVLNETIRKHPWYLYALATKALQTMQEADPADPDSTAEATAEVERLFDGPPTDISLLYPERKTFHYSEVENFLLVCINYEILKQNPNAAESQLKLLKEVGFENKPILNALSQRIGLTRMMVNMKALMGADTDTSIGGEFRAEDSQTEEAPAFNHSEVHLLYEYGFELPDEYLRQILALPRHTLTADLSAVLTDAVNRYWYFMELDWSEKTHSFPFHALLIAAELQADDCFEAVLNLLRQDDEFLEYWFSDWSETLIEPYLTPLIPQRADDLRNFVCESAMSGFAKAMTAEAMVQYILRNPDHRPAALHWFREVMSFLLAHADDPALHDTDLMASLTAYACDLKLTELLPLIEQIYGTNLASLNMMGDFKDVKKAFGEPQQVKDKLRETEPVQEHYQTLRAHMERAEKEEKDQLANPKKGDPDIGELLSLFGGDDNDKEEDDDWYVPQQPIKVVQKPGRNDKVTVQYTGGKLMSDVKYKKVEADLQAGKCVLVE